MELKAIVPHEGTGPTICWQIERQYQGWTTSAHRQDHTPLFTTHRLRRPMDRVETFGAPRVFHFHLWVSLAQVPGGIDIGKKSMDHHLDRLTMQSEPSFGCSLQFVAPRPLRVGCTCLLVQVTAHVPRLGRFHLRIPQAPKE